MHVLTWTVTCNRRRALGTLPTLTHIITVLCSLSLFGNRPGPPTFPGVTAKLAPEP